MAYTYDGTILTPNGPLAAALATRHRGSRRVSEGGFEGGTGTVFDCVPDIDGPDLPLSGRFVEVLTSAKGVGVLTRWDLCLIKTSRTG
jgi:hypothetical protein